jgi:hypothetical protein
MKKYTLVILLLLSTVYGCFFSASLGKDTDDYPWIKDRFKLKYTSESKNKIIIEHIGPTTKPIETILIECQNEANGVNDVKLSRNYKEFAENLGSGYIISLNSNEYGKVKEIIESYINESTANIKNKIFGTFAFKLYQDNEIENKFILEKIPSRKLFEELYELYKNNKDIGEVFFWNNLSRISPVDAPLHPLK